MFFPYSSETPVYYWPVATCCFIVANIFVYYLQSFAGGHASDPGWYMYALVHGNGLFPQQWLTSIFVHGNFVHLIGNMFFLWTFGVIVEGKVGPYLFNAIYLFIGVGQRAMEQILFMSSDERMHSFGSSGAICGIAMIAILWAAQDHVKCAIWYFVYVFPVDIPIGVFGGAFFGWDLIAAYAGGYNLTSVLMHLAGGLFGLGIGTLMFATSLVKCEKRDLFSLFNAPISDEDISNDPTIDAKENVFQQQQRQLKEQRENETRWKSIKFHLHGGNTQAATDLYQQLVETDDDREQRGITLFEIIHQWQKQKNWDQVEHYSNIYIGAGHDRRDDIILNLARMMLLHRGRPRKALKLLGELDQHAMNAKQIQVYQKIATRAEEEILKGVIEIEE